MPDQLYDTYHANDRIPLGDLIKAYMVHHLTPNYKRHTSWHRDEQLMRATLNHISELVDDLPGPIEVPH